MIIDIYSNLCHTSLNYIESRVNIKPIILKEKCSAFSINCRFRWTIYRHITVAKFGTNLFAFFPSMVEIPDVHELLNSSDLSMLYIIIYNFNTIVGFSRYFNIDHKNPSIEIGHMWLVESYHRPQYTKSNFLMLQHALEHLNCKDIEI